MFEYLFLVGLGDALPAIMLEALGEPRPIIVLPPLAGDPLFIKEVFDGLKLFWVFYPPRLLFKFESPSRLY